MWYKNCANPTKHADITIFCTKTAMSDLHAVCKHISIYLFDKTSFCSGEKQGMLINDECRSWYNRVDDF